MRARYRPFEYLWFLEFQLRNAPHIHILTNVDNPNNLDREWVANRWSDSLLAHSLLLREYKAADVRQAREKMVRQHRRSQVWAQIRLEDGAMRYVTKYATKPEQKIVPKDFARVGRFWGVSKNVRPKHLITSGANEEMMRVHLTNKNHHTAKYAVLPQLIWGTEGSQDAEKPP